MLLPKNIKSIDRGMFLLFMFTKRYRKTGSRLIETFMVGNPALFLQMGTVGILHVLKHVNGNFRTVTHTKSFAN